jgi:hypothetical protein
LVSQFEGQKLRVDAEGAPVPLAVPLALRRDRRSGQVSSELSRLAALVLETKRRFEGRR